MWELCAGPLFFNMVFGGISSLATILLLNAYVYMCYVPLLMVPSAVYDCDSSWSYSLVEKKRLLAIQIALNLYKYMIGLRNLLSVM